MSLLDYLRVLRRGWWVIVLVTAMGSLAATALTMSTPPTYTATATVYVSVNGPQTPTDLQSGSSFATARATTYADLATSTAVLHRAAATLDEGSDTAQLRKSVTSAARTDTSLVDITSTGGDAAAVAAQANAVATALTAEAPLLDAPGPTSPVRLTVVQSADAPETPLSPKSRNNLLIGLIVGLVLGVAVVVVTDALSTKIRSSADLPETAGLVTLTSMPRGPAKRSRHVSTTDARLEAIRQLRTNLQFGSHVQGTIAVAGVTAASDAREVAHQLGAAFGEIGAAVVVVDLDLRPLHGKRGRRAHVAERAPAPGVADVLGGAGDIDEVVTMADGEMVHQVPAGRVDGTSAQRMSTPAAREMLEKLSARFDYVVLACPPVVGRSEAAVAAALADSVLVVVESGETGRSDYLYAVELLAGVQVRSISVAIDHVRSGDLGARRATRPSAPPQPETSFSI